LSKFRTLFEELKTQEDPVAAAFEPIIKSNSIMNTLFRWHHSSVEFNGRYAAIKNLYEDYEDEFKILFPEYARRQKANVFYRGINIQDEARDASVIREKFLTKAPSSWTLNFEEAKKFGDVLLKAYVKDLKTARVIPLDFILEEYSKIENDDNYESEKEIIVMGSDKIKEKIEVIL